MKQTLGLILRTGGLLIEMVCLFFYFKLRADPRMLGGMPVRLLPQIGLLIGLAIWATGILLLALARQRRRS